MDIFNLTIEKLKQCDLKAVNELEKQIRREKVVLRMDIYGNSNASKKHALKKSLARVLTVKNKI